LRSEKIYDVSTKKSLGKVFSNKSPSVIWQKVQVSFKEGPQKAEKEGNNF